MKRREFINVSVSSLMLLGSASVAPANVPPPPVNQFIGIPDGVFNNLTEADCRSCHENPDITKPGYIPDRHHLRVGKRIQSPSDVPYSVNTVSGPGGTYECLSCHRLVYNAARRNYEFELFRDCLLCHRQELDKPVTVHHRTPDAVLRNCKACHGPIDNPYGGHYVPKYPPSLVTPKPGIGTGLEGRGGCAFCHRSGANTIVGIDTSTGREIQVFNNAETHHSTGVVLFPSGYTHYLTDPVCWLCHPKSVVDVKIRACETCHGINSLHNIQHDSDGNGLILPGGEKSWYGHVGTQEDCWGCHGFKASSITGDEKVADAVIPNLTRLDKASIVAGTNVPITAHGSAMQNEHDSGILNSSMKLMNTQTGLTAMVSPAKINENMMTVSAPSYLPEGTYKVQLVKNQQVSNALSITILPKIRIEAARCRDFGGNWKSIVVNGVGFGRYSQGMQAANAGVGISGDGTSCVVNNWSDTEIMASCRACPTVVTVDAVHGAASAPIGVSTTSSCTTCHGDTLSLVSCSNKKWDAHVRRGLVDAATAIAIETKLGLNCAPSPSQIKNRAKKK